MVALEWIPAGSFLMGSSPDEDGHQDHESPTHLVSISQGFWMGRYEVTQDQYRAVAGINPSTYVGDDSRPVENVDWNDADAFCQAASSLTGRAIRLPSEAEWEYACRAGSMTRFNFGDADDCADDDCQACSLEDHAWFCAGSAATTHPAGRKLPNAWGLYDMHGNVWEWCLDTYQADYYARSASTDPVNETPSPFRVFRGGSYKEEPGILRSAARGANTPDTKRTNIGFRIIVSDRAPGESILAAYTFDDDDLNVTIGGNENGSVVTSNAPVPVSDPESSDGRGLRVDAVAGDAVLVILDAVTSDEPLMMTVNVISEQDGATVGLVALDATLLGDPPRQNMSYLQANGIEVISRQPRALIITHVPRGGFFLPALQVVGPATVYFDNLIVSTLDRNQIIDLSQQNLNHIGRDAPGFDNSNLVVSGDMRLGASGFLENLNSQPHNPAQHFFEDHTGNGTGSVALRAATADGSLSNISAWIDMTETGTYEVESYCRVTDGSGGFFVQVVNALAVNADGVASAATYVAGEDIVAEGGWAHLETVVQVEDGSGGVLLTLQSAGGDVTISVDDISIHRVDLPPSHFDPTLLGG